MKIFFYKVKVFLLSFIMIFVCIAGTSHADTKVNIFIDGSPLVSDVPGVVLAGSNRTVVPFRVIFEALGAEVSWDDATNTVVGTKDNTNIMMKIGVKSISVNGTVHTIDAAPIIKQSRTMVPLRVVSEHLGAKVDWDGDNMAVKITTNGNSSSTPVFDMPEIQPELPDNNSQNIENNNQLVNIVGTFALQDINKNQYMANFKSDMTLEIKNIIDGKSMAGIYSVNGDNYTITSPIISSTFVRSDHKYKNRIIVLMRDTKDGTKTFAMIPISIDDYNRIIKK